MSENENQQSTIAANLCKNGCGFYGSTQFDGMCSVCHKENMKKRQKQDEEQIQKPTSSPHAASLLCASSSLQQSAFSAGSDQIAAAADSAAGANTNEDCHAASDPTDGVGMPLKPDAAVSAGTAAATGKSAEVDSVCSSGASASVGSSGTADSSSLSKKPNRCGMCRKKIGLTGFNCRCGGQFCSLHRYSDKHDCQFDYQSHGQAEIRKANPQVVSAKIEKL